MIKILKTDDGRFGAVFVCDVCNEPIRHAGSAIEVSEGDGPAKPGESVQCYHVHKGLCDDAMGDRLPGGTPGSTELSHHILQLVLNSGLTPEKLERMGTAAVAMGSI